MWDFLINYMIVIKCFLLQQQGISPVSSAAKGKMVSYNVDLCLASNEVLCTTPWATC